MSEQKDFTLKKAGDNRVLTWSATVLEPQDGGGTEAKTLRPRFLMLPRVEIDALAQEQISEMQGKRIDRKLSKEEKALKDADLGTPLLRKVLKGFDGLKFDDGKGVSNDAAAIRGVLALSYTVPYLTSAYYEMAQGRAAKNS